MAQPKTNPWMVIVLATAILAIPGCTPAEPAPDSAWKANAVLMDADIVSDVSIGSGQGVSIHDARLYVYGDVYTAVPRVGIIREYTLDLKPTGRDVKLTRNGEPLIVHPTGLTWDNHHGCFLGNTVNQIATIFQIDWDRALADGNLDHAVLAAIRDDAAVNGCRPEFVQLHGRPLLATADYGNVTPQIRLYDPERMLVAKRTKAEGVIRSKIHCGPFNQNLVWDEEQGELTCVQNVVAGRGWQLDVINLAAAVEAGNVEEDGVRAKTIRLNPHDELEGYRMLPDGRALFVTSSRARNLVRGRIALVGPYLSEKGNLLHDPREADQRSETVPAGR